MVGETYSAMQAMEMVERLKPDLVLMDVEMGEISGLQATHSIKRQHPATQVVLMSIYDEREYSRLARIAGALAFVIQEGPQRLYPVPCSPPWTGCDPTR